VFTAVKAEELAIKSEDQIPLNSQPNDNLKDLAKIKKNPLLTFMPQSQSAPVANSRTDFTQTF